jgi:hypothetical protein
MYLTGGAEYPASTATACFVCVPLGEVLGLAGGVGGGGVEGGWAIVSRDYCGRAKHTHARMLTCTRAHTLSPSHRHTRTRAHAGAHGKAGPPGATGKRGHDGIRATPTQPSVPLQYPQSTPEYFIEYPIEYLLSTP